MKYTIEGTLVVKFTDFETNAESKEEALNKLLKLDADQILQQVAIEESDITDEKIFVKRG